MQYDSQGGNISISPGHRNASLVPKGIFLLYIGFFISFTQFDIYLSSSAKLNYLVVATPAVLLCMATFFYINGSIYFLNKAFGASLILSMFSLFSFNNIDADSIFRVILFLCALFCASMIVTSIILYTQAIRKILIVLLWLNAIVIIGQFLIYLLSSYTIDIHHFVFPFSRVSEIGAIHGFGFVRFNGLQLEPGTYAAMVGVLAAISLGLERRIKIIYLVIIVTLLLTRSASAILYAGILSIMFSYYFMRSYPGRFFSTSPMGITVILFLAYYSDFFSYIETRLGAIATDSDGSSRIKSINLNYLLESDVSRQIIGSGFLHIDCIDCEYINSNGAVFAAWFFFGAIGIIFCLFVLCLGFKRSFVGGLLALMVLLSRHTFHQMSFWIPIMLLICSAKFGAYESKAWKKSLWHKLRGSNAAVQTT